MAPAITYYRKCGFEVIEQIPSAGQPPTMQMARWFNPTYLSP
jgi:hypothetical protein